MPNAPSELSPRLFFDTVNAYQRTAVLRAAVAFDLFSAIASGTERVEELATVCNASERGMRILCDYLVIVGFLAKDGRRYKLQPEASRFLDRRSKEYIGQAIEFLLSPILIEAFSDVTSAVRNGTTALANGGIIATNHPVWISFAHAMGPMAAVSAGLLVKLIDPDANRMLRILDIAAGHGMFGIEFAKRNPKAEITAIDWFDVLEVAKANAQAAGVAQRYLTKPGSALDTEYGGGYDVILLANFLHHFEPLTCATVLKKVRGALADGGLAVTVEFVPNEDRVSPPDIADFSMLMLCSTPGGDAYTFGELESMFSSAGFSSSEIIALGSGLEQVVVSRN
jgi:hypothetical protein